jgi:4-hydroxybenzoate polyprenyltransferase
MCISGQIVLGGTDIGRQTVSLMSRIAALARAGHAGPSLVLATIVTALVANEGVAAADLVVFGVAALAGQLSIGWSNDFFDAGRDAAAGRRDKPVVAGLIERPSTLFSAAAAVAVSAAANFALSPRTGVVNAAMLATGWAYNAGLKSTVLSGLTYAVGFGLVPILAATMAPGQPLPRAWTVLAAVLLGLGGHFANVVPDLDSDHVVGVLGLPQRVARSRFGPRAVRLIAIVLLGLASAILAVVAGAPRAVGPTVAFAVSAIIALVGLRGRGRIPFYAALAIGVLDVALLIGYSDALV